MTARQVKCPHCGKPTLFTPENPSRPFCSERCKLIDLGAWAEEKYAVPVAPATEEELRELMESLESADADKDDGDLT